MVSGQIYFSGSEAGEATTANHAGAGQTRFGAAIRDELTVFAAPGGGCEENLPRRSKPLKAAAIVAELGGQNRHTWLYSIIK